jgi:hypothetical protein
VRDPVLMFCAPTLLMGATEGVGFNFHVLPSRTYFRRYQGRRVPFLCFALPVPFWAVPRASTLIFIFHAPRLIYGGTEGVGVLFLCFSLPDSYPEVPRASGIVFRSQIPFRW